MLGRNGVRGEGLSFPSFRSSNFGTEEVPKLELGNQVKAACGFAARLRTFSKRDCLFPANRLEIRNLDTQGGFFIPW